MSVYPEALDEFREIKNRPQVVFDPDKVTTIFAEDLERRSEAIQAIEDTLGYDDEDGYNFVGTPNAPPDPVTLALGTYRAPHAFRTVFVQANLSTGAVAPGATSSMELRLRPPAGTAQAVGQLSVSRSALATGTHTQICQTSCIVPPGWEYAIFRTSGTIATVSSLFETIFAGP